MVINFCVYKFTIRCVRLAKGLTMFEDVGKYVIYVIIPSVVLQSYKELY